MDNATNFVGANSQLKVFYKTLNFPDQNLEAYFTEEGIEWNFIPPRAPHMGGLWEAGIKSVKYHLKRTLGRSRLTYEEFETGIIQVEGILNSRPLTPISNDFDNFERGKWMIEKDNVMCGTMVIVKEDFAPVCNWLLGRIVEVYHGSDAFKKWKLEIERKNLVHYCSPHGAKKLSFGIRRLYTCHRSGIYTHQAKSDRKRANRLLGTRKTGVMCTSEIICYERPNEVYVKYCPNHYGHGKETPYLQLSAEEQAAIQENISRGITFQEQVDDIRNGLSEADHYRAGVIKKRDMRMIERAFAAEIYDTGMTDIESVEQWIKLCFHLETFPILFYHPESSNAKEKSFILTIMTEYQKYILVASSKQVVCIHSYFRFKALAPSCLTVLFVMDEYNVAFPVAFCISSKLDKNVLLNFLLSIKKVTGPLSCTYLMSDSEDLYYEAWQEVMCDDSMWVWSIWSMDNDFQVHLRRLLKDVKKRENTYRVLRKLLECNNEHVFTTMFKNLIASLLKDSDSKSFGEFLIQKYGSNAERWACCYRKDIKLSTNIFLESLHRTISYCSKMIGRKVETYRLNKLLLILLKWVRYKMLDRFTNLEDDDKMIMAKDTISACHDLGLEINCEAITALSDKTWLILSEEVEDKIYVTRDFETCPELCDLKCSDCDVCVHMFSCSCLQSLINANMCPHIHAVVWKFLTPHFSPPASPTLENSSDVDLVIPNNCPELLENILKRMSDVYKKVRENKYKLNQEALSEVLKMLNRCHDICSEKEVISKSDTVSQTSLTLLSHPSNVSNSFSHIRNIVEATTSSFNLSDISSNFASNTPYVIETISPSASSSNKSNDFESHTSKSTKSSILPYHKLNISKDSLNKLISPKHQKIKATTSASKKAYYLKAIIKPKSSSSNIPNSSLNTKTSPCVLHVTPDRLLI
ncbi:uncharacterized protein TNCV_1697881 [Trichonephila clavipes]|nr:uncharacterized protein TNCV_1697881 [Trichonephila clavipes]